MTLYPGVILGGLGQGVKMVRQWLRLLHVMHRETVSVLQIVHLGLRDRTMAAIALMKMTRYSDG